MKNFSLLWRSLSVATLLFLSVGLSAQDCDLTPANISITAIPACQTGSFPSEPPYVVIDFGNGSGFVDGPITLELQGFYQQNFAYPPVTINTTASFGIASFEMPGLIFPTFGQTIQLIELTVSGNCSQDFTADGVFSNQYSLSTSTGIMSVSKNTTRSIDPPCENVGTGRLSVNVTPNDGNFAPGRFSAQIYPNIAGASVFAFEPGAGPNTSPNSFLIETSAVLEAGMYDLVISDNTRACDVVFSAEVGSSSNFLALDLDQEPVTCFDYTDGEIDIDILNGDPNVNGSIFVQLTRPNGSTTSEGNVPVSGGSYLTKTIANLVAGDYTVVATSTTTGCTTSSDITVTTPDEITATVSVDPICASDAGGTFNIDVEALMGVSGQPLISNLNYRIINPISNCWDTGVKTATISNTGDYVLLGDVPASSNCLDPTVDGTVNLFLEIYQDGNLTCSERFPFVLFVKATPPTPELAAYTVDGADSLASHLCSGADIELLVTNYDANLTYTVALDASLPADVVTGGGFADSSFVYAGVVSGTITNNTNAAVQITYNVTATNEDAPLSCDSETESITLLVRPQPFLTAFADGTATDTVCSDQPYSSPNVRLNGSNGSSGGNSNVRWNYEWDVPADLTYSGGLALSAEGLANNATTGDFAFENNSGAQQVATLTITPIFPHMVTTLSGATVADTCFGESYAIALTVEPVTDLEVRANGVFASEISFTPSSVTICSNSDITFDADLFGVDGARYKIARILSSAPNVTNGVFGQLAAETRDLDDDFSETLRNSGSTTETVTYEFRSYTYGPNGEDGGSDDCIGESVAVNVHVLPEISNESILVINGRTVNGNTLFSNQSICSFDEFGIELSSSLNAGEFRYEWTRTVSGGTLIGLDANNTSGATGDFMSGNPEIEQELATGGNSAVTVTYTIVAVTPGPDGFFGTSDDCTGGDTETVSVTVEPTPTLAFDVNGSLFTFDQDTIITICSGEDFLIDNLVIPQTASSTGDLKYVEFDYQGDASFLDIVSGDRGVYSINNFQLGTTDVENTSPDNSFQIVLLEFTPYFEDQGNTTTNFEECEGETITLTVIINPAVPDIMTQDEVLCSSEVLATPLAGGTGTGGDLLTILSGEETFSATNNEFIIPAGAHSITNISFELDGANGGASTGAGNNGGAGYHFEGLLNNSFLLFNNNAPLRSSGFPVHPGDTIRTVLGSSGADGVNSGDGGDASSFIIYAGPNSLQPQGSIVHAFVAAGGGGAGANETGGSAFFVENSLGASTDDGTRGASFGGFGGLGFPNGYTGGAGVSKGGGGGGGYSGGNGGGNLAAASGEAGTSLNFGPGVNGRQKDGRDGTEGSASMSYTIVFDDVIFSVVSKTMDPGLVDLNPTNVTPGMTMGSDTLLYGERFSNPTNGPLTVAYELTTTTEAGCGEAGSFTYTLTVEPNATGRFMSNGTEVTEVTANEAYEATICSGDSLSALLTSDIMTSGGGNGAVYFFVENIENNGGLTILGNSIERASATDMELMGAQSFGGNNGTAPFPILFFEEGIENLTGTAQTITYTVASRIFNPVEDHCEGTSFTLTVTVLPGFDPVNITSPVSTDVCSGDSFSEAGFSIDADVYSATNSPAVDGIWLLSYDVVPGISGRNEFIDTLSGPDFGGADSIKVSIADFEAYRFRNRTGGAVTIDFEVRLAAGTDCVSEVIDLSFISRAEPVIEAPEDGIVRDTICSGDFAGFEIMPGMFSAFGGDFISGDNNVQFYYEADIPTGIDTLSGVEDGDYPATYSVNDTIANDQFQNRTGAPITVTYRVVATATPFGCGSDTVTFALVVEPEPMTDVVLVAGDSTATYGLFNARLFQPNPVFEICANEAITTSLVNTSASSTGDTLMARVVITDPAGVTRFDRNSVTMDSALFTIPVADLDDSLSFATNELTNTGAAPLTFTVSYATFFNNPGSPNCVGSGITEFDVTVLPSRTAEILVLGGIAAGDTLCSGADFDLRFRDDSNVAGVRVDSFQIEVIAPGLTPEAGTTTETFVVTAGVNAPYAVRVNGFAYSNTSAGVKSVQYVARPFSSNGCLGLPDTLELFYLPETVLNADIPLICGVDGIATAITPVDSNEQVLSTDRQQYRWEYIGGTASGFSIEPTFGNGFDFVANPAAQANGIVLNNQLSIVLTPGAGFIPGEVRFEVIYDNDDTGCGMITDTIVVNYSTEANAGTLDPALGVLCDGVNFLLTDALIGESEGGVFTDANGDPVGSLNFTPMVGGSDPTPVPFEFTYTVGGGNSGCPVASTTFSVMVEPAPNAGALNLMADNEACQSAIAFNLFDIIDGATPGGTFTQTAGVDFVAVASDGVFDQNSITAGTYVFEYEVTSANGCGSDVLAGITVEVLSQTECSTVVPCDTINLFAGFNVISFDALPADMTIENIFADDIAANNLLSVFTINPDNGSSEIYTYNPVFGTTSNGISEIRDGLGYIVEVVNPSQVITCGIAADTELRVALVSGLNVVGYTPQESQEELDYFDDLISAGDLNSIITIDKFNQSFLRATFNPLNGDIINMNNSQGYLLDVSVAYATNTWRDDQQMATSKFDRFFGYTDIPSEYAGQYIRFVDGAGNVYGKVEVGAEGTYENMIVFGDLEVTERLVEGLSVGAEIFAEFRGETIATGARFNGNWNLRQLDLNFPQTTTAAAGVEPEAFAMKLFPNPTAGTTRLNLDLEEDYDFVRVEVSGMLGQLVADYELSNQLKGSVSLELDLLQLPAGTYNILIFTENGLKGREKLIRK